MIGIVVVTHGRVAEELVNAARTIHGELPGIARGVDRLGRRRGRRERRDRARHRRGRAARRRWC